MAPINGIYFALASICLLLCNVAVAQDSSTTETDPSTTTTDAVSSTTSEAPIVPVDCKNAKPVEMNGTLLLGTWYAAARKPVGLANNKQQCIQVIVEYKSEQFTVHQTYSTDEENLSKNQTKSVILKASEMESSVMIEPIFNFTENGNTYTYKVLETDYESYAFVCTYLSEEASTDTTTTTSEGEAEATTTESTPTSTVAASSTDVPSSTDSTVTTTSGPVIIVPAGATVLTRETEVNSTHLSKLIANAAVGFTDFKSLSTVTQSDKCRGNGSSSTAPAVAMIMVAIYSLLKFVH